MTEQLTDSPAPSADEAVLAPLTPDAATLHRLQRRLGAQAGAEGLLDIAYTTVDTPVGSLLVAATDKGVLRVAFEREGHDAVLQSLATLVSPRILRHEGRLGAAVSQIERYFAGTLRRFELPLDLRLVAGFRLEVVRHLTEIGYGRTESYAEVAAATGRPLAVRAVGTACGRNPLPVVVPCHRVVRSDGSFGGYLGGAEAKHTLLALERSAA
jgi:methylated-DNA-[protein]-cysteine S-methyltransferase